MADTTKSRSTGIRAGWMALLLVSGLVALNGVAWFFIGPDSAADSAAERIGVAVTELEATYPELADSVRTNARQVAIWFMAFGVMSFIVALAGRRHGARWAWSATWLLFGATAAVAVLELSAGGTAFGSIMLVLAIVALTGQILAGRQPG